MNVKKGHNVFEDILALFCATIFVAMGLSIFESLGFLVGGTAGIALLLSHVTEANFSLLFFLVNLPFYYLAWTQLGMRFTLNTFASVTIAALIIDRLPTVFDIAFIEPWFAAVIGGLMLGIGMLIMFRHKSSLGGVGILAFYLQSKYNIRAGKFQLCVDACIVLISFFIVSPFVLLMSMLGAAVMNIIIAVNHKPGRYMVNYSEALSNHQNKAE